MQQAEAKAKAAKARSEEKDQSQQYCENAWNDRRYHEGLSYGLQMAVNEIEGVSTE